MSSYDEGYCLVLSGGGAKGAYHIGVWRALQELEIPVTSIIGSSIGACLGAAFAMGDQRVWDTAETMFSIDHVLKLPESFVEDGQLKLSSGEFKDVRETLQTIVKKQGLDTTPFQEMIRTWISEETIRSSGIDFGVNTIDLSSRKPKELFLEDIPEGKLNDYILASAAFPGFERPKIDGHSYIDGGVYDSMPYQMARKRGYTNIIVSDISGVGVKHKFNFVGTRTVYIKNTSSMGGVLDFDRKVIDSLVRFGYLDTLRSFGAIIGDSYYLEKESGAEERFNALSKTAGFQSVWEGVKEELYLDPEAFENLRIEHSRYDRRRLMLFCDYAAAILHMDRTELYSYQRLQEGILRKSGIEQQRLCEHLGTCTSNRNLEIMNSLERIVKFGLDASLLKEPPYYLLLMVQELLPAKNRKGVLGRLVKRFPELPGGLLLIRLLEQGLIEQVPAI